MVDMTENFVSKKANVLLWMRQWFDVHSWQTVRRWKKDGLPIRYLPNNVPFIIPSEVIAWVVEHDELVRGRK